MQVLGRIASWNGLLSLGLLFTTRLAAQPRPPAPPLPPFPPPPPGVVVEATLPAPPSVEVEVVGATPPPPTTVTVVEGGPSQAATQSRMQFESHLVLPLRLLAELDLGWSMMDPATDGHTGAFGLGFDLDLTEWFALGVHGHASFRNQLTPDLDRDGRADAPSIQITTLSATLGPRFRLLTAEDARDQLGLELGLGVLWIPEMTRPWGAMVDVALFGGIDLRSTDPTSNGGFLLYPMVRYQQGLADAGSYRALLVGLGAGVDIDAAPRRREGPRTGPHFTLGFDGALGGGFLRQGTIREGFTADLGMRMGLVLEEVFEPMVRLDFMHRMAGDKLDGLDVYGLAGGFRVLFDPWAPLYLEALGGWAVRNGTPAALVPGGAFVDAGAGLRWIDCGDSNLAIVAGVRARIGVLEDDALSSIFGVFGLEMDGGPRPDRPRCQAAPAAQLAFEAPPPPTEYVPIAPPPTPEVTTTIEAPAPTPVPARAPARARVETPAAPEAPRAPSGPSHVPLSIEGSYLLGFGESDRDMNGMLQGGSLALGVAPIDELVLLLRFTGLGGEDGAIDVAPRDFMDDDPTRGPLALLLGGDVRLRVFTDRAERSGWTFELGGGWLTLDGVPRAGRPLGWLNGGYVEAAIGHQRGVRFEDGGAIQFGMALRFQQGLGDTLDYRALLLTGSMMIEGDTPRAEPAGRHADFDYTLGLHLDGGISFYRYTEAGLRGTGGVGVHFGLPIGRWFEPRVETDLRFISTNAEKATAPLLAFLGVLRLRLDEVFPLYIDAGAGYALHYDVAQAYSPGTAFVDFGVGARMTDCSGSLDGALELGVRMRIGVEGPRTDDALLLTLGIEYDGGTPMFQPNERAHCRASTPPEGAETVRERQMSRPPGTSVDVEIPAPPSGSVIIDVTPPAPPSGSVIIDVTPPAPPSGSVVIQPPPPPPGAVVAPPSRTGTVVVQPRGSGTVVVQPDASR